MSTFLVSLGVVAATIAAVVYVVLNGPDQPATIRRQPSRVKDESRRARRRAPAPAGPSSRMPVLAPGGPTVALPDSDIMRLRVQPARQTTLWVRVRSGVALMVLVGVLGALLALTIGATGLGVALLVRSATG